jgi:Family of unknown function (DUF6152)
MAEASAAANIRSDTDYQLAGFHEIPPSPRRRRADFQRDGRGIFLLDWHQDADIPAPCPEHLMGTGNDWRKDLTMTSKWIALPAGALALALASPAWSHHSHAMFDHTKQISITGTVTNFDFRNPHAGLYLDAEQDGKKVNYWVEMSNVPNMIRRGIGKATFKPGDKVTVTLHPLSDGRAGGNYIKVIANDGKQYE